ncbi:aminoglycoside phosphotransferase family protein [Streptomyces sp. NPDC060194]|uniref:aminoglycoside phosphotransferase family protein n=1 Tax=Streptomyces sp. NPDC060194 TaxID=3347069 RepID=UPI00364894CB
MHVDQVDVGEETVAALVRAQFPRWAGLPVRAVASDGTVNAIFRIGDRLAARLPLRLAPADAVRAELVREAAASAEFARVSPFPGPEPVALGEPGEGYPMPWAVQTWLSGTVAAARLDELAGSYAFARDLADLVAGLRTAGTGGRRFSGGGRGGVLADHDAWVNKCLAVSGDLLDVPHLRELWRSFRELPPADADAMSHTDLMPGNLLVAGDRLTGVLDTGGFAPADPALDLIAGWHLLDDGPRDAFRTALACDALTWERGRAWAFEQALGLVEYYALTNPVMSATGRRTLERVVAAGA